MNIKKYISVLILLVLFKSGISQVKTNLNNSKLVDIGGFFEKPYSTKVDFILPSKNIPELLQKEKVEIANSSETKPFQLADPTIVDLDVIKLANWKIENDFSYCKYTIQVSGALSNSINFDNFFLPQFSEMYLYNKNGEMITGAITENENNKNNIWGSWVFQGEIFTIEIKTPTKTFDKLKLHINNIAYGYKEVYKSTKVGGFNQSQSCNLNVLCPQGNGWEPERNSVSLILSDNGSTWCSGSMVMNTCNTNRPFFLTANHCFNPPGLPQQDEKKWRFTFQAWSPTCVPNQNSNGVITYNGSTLRANWAGSDVCLVELNNTPANNLGIHYAGWSRSTTPATSGVGIHHPRGDVMKISTYTVPLVRADNPNLCGIVPISGLSWVVNWNSGVTEGGSSGSPLFNQEHRIVGQLGGGPSSCTAGLLCKSDGYGRFDNSWTGGGTNSTRLSNWLDETNSGAVTTNTTNILNLGTPNNNLTISGDASVCTTSNPYSLPGLAPSSNVVWSVLPLGIVTINTPNAPQTTITKNYNGSFNLTANVTNCQGTTSISKTFAAGIPTFRGWYNSKNNPQEPLNPWNKNSQFTNLVCYGSFITTITDISANASVVWQPSGIIPTGIQWYQIGNNLRFVLTDINQDAYFVVTITNACGTTNIRYKFTSTADNCPGANPLKAQISPNPASNLVSVSLMDNAEISKQKEITEIRLVDKMGNVKQKWNYEKGNATQTRQINVSSFPADVYIIMIFDGTNWISEKFIKQ